MSNLKIIFVDVCSSNLPSLGLAYLAAVLRERLGIKDVKILQKKFIDDLPEKIISEKPDIVGYISFTPFMNPLLETARKVAEDSNIHQIIGGPHITGLPEALPSEMEIGVVNEGEETICELVEIFKQDGCFPLDKLHRVKGIVFYDQDDLIKTKKREPINDLNSLPMPARDLLNIKGYFPSTIDAFPFKDFKASGILTSRGCPFHCIFCQPAALFKYRFCSAERVLAEIEELVYKYNVNFIQILEDQFLSNRERFKTIVNQIIKRNLHKKAAFLVCARADQLDEEICQLLRNMNVRIVGIGLESGSDPILKYLKDSTCSVATNQRALDLCKKYNLYVYGAFLFGSPSETMEDMEKTYQFIKKNFAPMFIDVSTLTPLPGTGVWDYAEERNLVSYDMNWDDLLLRVREDKNKPWLCERVSREEFFKFFHEFIQPLGWHYHQIIADFSPKDLFSYQFIRKFRESPKKYLSAFKHTLIHFWRRKMLQGKGNFPD